MAHLVGTSEIAALLGVSRQRVDQLIAAYPDFPPPVAEISAGRIWRRAPIETWALLHQARAPGRSSSRTVPLDSLGEEARDALLAARAEAVNLRHNYLGCEHLLFALLDQRRSWAKRIRELGVPLQRIRRSLLELVGPGRSGEPGSLEMTPRALEAIGLAQEEAESSGAPSIQVDHLLLGILLQSENLASHVLREQKIDADSVRERARRGNKTERKARPGKARDPSLVPSRRLDRIEVRLQSIEKILRSLTGEFQAETRVGKGKPGGKAGLTFARTR